ncbi:rRNA pseudouridine synthase [bacterium]|nr:rRNA pseudouridine synthase [bacterium]MBU1884115.1 rRNA pseudouridine synthase [bacterium]
MRLNKYIAHYSSYSRREADKAIEAGYVRVDGEVQINPGTQIDEKYAKVSVSGKKVTPTEQYTVIAYNKEKGELVTKTDPKGRKTIYDTLPSKYKHFIPIGRLDFATEGLLLLTDASRVATALMTSSMERVYRVKVKGEISEEMEIAMKNGLELDDASAGAHDLSEIKSMNFAPFYAYKIIKTSPTYSILKIAIGEGQNREVRRFFAHFDREVVDLKRLSFGGIELNNLPNGKVRFLTRSEYGHLYEFMKVYEREQKGQTKEPKTYDKEAKSQDRDFKSKDKELKSHKKDQDRESKGYKKDSTGYKKESKNKDSNNKDKYGKKELKNPKKGPRK